jgi:ubiquinone/menaquinone biosynthesis C-methylase UbiE
MREETLQMMCNPYYGEPFKQDGDTLVGIISGRRYPIRDGIPAIVENNGKKKQNLFSKVVYNTFAFAYDPIVRFGEKLRVNTENIVRQSYIQQLEVKPGDKVLETALGTGSNIQYLPPHGKYYGLDLSYPLLKKAQAKLTANYPYLELVQADGAFVPFRDNMFDLVFHMGGIQFYANPFRGVSEMARVAKPGTVVHVIDEISGAIRTLRRLPAHRRYSVRPEKALEGIKHLVPHSMQEVTCKPIPNSDFYILSFRKPDFLVSQQF